MDLALRAPKGASPEEKDQYVADFQQRLSVPPQSGFISECDMPQLFPHTTRR